MTMIVFCPTIYHALRQRNASDLIIDDNNDFWYDSLNDCYKNQMSIKMICTYVEAINDDDIK